MKHVPAFAIGVTLALLGVAGCKGDPVACEKATRNYATLVYWEGAETAIAAVPEADREKLRKEKLGTFEAQMARGIDTLVSQCVSANNTDQVDCMIDAKTAAQARECTN